MDFPASGYVDSGFNLFLIKFVAINKYLPVEFWAVMYTNTYCKYAYLLHRYSTYILFNIVKPFKNK